MSFIALRRCVVVVVLGWGTISNPASPASDIHTDASLVAIVRPPDLLASVRALSKLENVTDARATELAAKDDFSGAVLVAYNGKPAFEALTV